jgi:putative ABC transport system ATP-binding protein
MFVLKAQDVSKKYQLGEHDVHALNGVTFQVQPGEFVAIMGALRQR